MNRSIKNLVCLLTIVAAGVCFAQEGTQSKPRPFQREDIIAMLKDGVASERIVTLLRERGIDFEPTDDYLKSVRLAGGNEPLVTAIREAQITLAPEARARLSLVREHQRKGYSLAQKKRFADAEYEYRRAIELDPSNERLHLELADVYLGEAKWDDVIAEARNALRLSADLLDAYMYLGLAQREKGALEEAAEAFREAIRIDPSDAVAHYSLATTLFGQADFRGSIGEYNETIRVNPEHANAYGDMAIAMLLTFDFVGARSAVRRALALNPMLSLSHNAAGVLQELGGDKQAALAEYALAHEIAPGDPVITANYRRLSIRNPKRAEGTTDPIALQGFWIGEFVDGALKGQILFSLQNEGQQITGIYASSHGGFGKVTGELRNGKFEFRLVQGVEGCPGSFSGWAPMTLGQINGTYSGEDCLGKHEGGTFTVLRILG
jgi:tetratricopeptide (TPR) repeat protein